jgi:hypothetical protein
MRELSNLFVRGSLVPPEPDVYLHEHRCAARRIMWMPVTADLLMSSSHWFLTIGAPCCSPRQSWANRGEGLSRSYSYYLDHARSGPRPGACVINGVSHGGHTHMQKRAAAKKRGLLRFCISEWLESTVEEVCDCARVDLRVRLSLASSHPQCAQLRLRHWIQ